MASSLPQNFYASTDGTEILVAFLPSNARTSPPGLIIDSRVVVGGRNFLQMTYLMTVIFDADRQHFFITEQVKSTARAGNGVIGTARIPFADLEQPIFEYGESSGGSIKISLHLKQATDFRTNHYSATTQGKWKDGTKDMLHLRQLDNIASKIGKIEINLPNAPMSPALVRTHILSIFNQTAVSQRELAQLNTKLARSLPETTEAGLLKPRKEDIETAEVNQKGQLKEKSDQLRKSGQDEDARLRLEKQQGLIKTQLAKQKSGKGCTTLCIASVMCEAEARNLIPCSYEEGIVEVIHITDLVGENYFLFDFGHEAIAQEALEAATHWVMVTQWPTPSPVVALVNNRTKRSILLSAVEEPPSTALSEDRSSTTDDEQLEKPEESEVSESTKAEHTPDVALMMRREFMLRHDFREIEKKYQLYQEQLQILLKAITALRQQGPSEDLDQNLDEQALRTSSSASQGRALFFSTTLPEENVLGVIDCTDRVWITKVVPTVGENDQKGFKIDVVSHGTASEALRNTGNLILGSYDEWKKRPTTDCFRGPPTAQAKMLSTNAGGARSFAQFMSQYGLEGGTELSPGDNQKFRFQIEDLKENYLIRESHIETLPDKIKNLETQLSTASTPSRESARDRESVDLLALDIEQDVSEESTLIHDINTTAQRQPSWLELELDMPGSFSSVDKNPAQSAGAASDQAVPDVKPMVSSRHVDDETILKIDDAVNFMAQVQKNALKAGKAVTVELREPDEMINWLAQRDSGVSTDSLKSSGTLAMLWL